MQRHFTRPAAICDCVTEIEIKQDDRFVMALISDIFSLDTPWRRMPSHLGTLLLLRAVNFCYRQFWQMYWIKTAASLLVASIKESVDLTRYIRSFQGKRGWGHIQALNSKRNRSIHSLLKMFTDRADSLKSRGIIRLTQKMPLNPFFRVALISRTNSWRLPKKG